MIGAIRTKESCPVCHQKFHVFKQCQKCQTPPAQINQKKCSCGGNYKIVEVPIICPTCRTSPGTFYFDLFWEDSLGKPLRFKFYQDPETGQEFDSWKACHRFAEHIRREKDNDGFDPSRYVKVDLEKFRFENYVWNWFDRSSPDFAPNTYYTWRTILKRYLVPYFGRADIRKITNGEVSDFLSSLKEIGGKYKRDILIVLKRIYSNALERQDIAVMPHFPKAKTEKPKHEWISREEQGEILKQIKPGYRPIFEFMILTGIRPGEARALKKDCLFFRERVIMIKRTFSRTTLKERPKDGDWRMVPMGSRVEEILRQQMKDISSDFVFTNSQGNPCGMFLSRAWNKACKAAGLDHIPMYKGTKHSFLTQKLNQGHSLDELAAIAGHSSTYMTQTYAKMQVDSLRAVMEDDRKVIKIEELKKFNLLKKGEYEF